MTARPRLPWTGLAALCALAGCGGASSNPAARAAGRGHATLRVLWPERSARLIPSAANSLVVSLSQGGTVVQTQTIARPGAGQSQTQTDFSDLDVATYDVAIRAYPSANGTGTAQATGAGTLSATVDGSGTVTVSLGSTVRTIEVAATSAWVALGATTTLTASAKDAGGNLVLLSAGGGTEGLTWSSDAVGVASVVGSGPSAVVTGASSGLANVSASMAVDDAGNLRSGSRAITVADPNAVPQGLLKWAYQTGNVIESSVALAPDGTVYAPSEDSRLYALNPDGSLKWSYLLNGAPVIGGATLGADGTVYLGSSDGRLYAVNPNGTLKWAYATGSGIRATPTIDANGTVYIGSSDSRLYAINPNGTLRWAYATASAVYSRPTIGPDGTVYFGSMDSNYYALNPNGTLKWSYETGGPIWYTAPTLGADGTVYGGSMDGKFYAINPNGSLKWSRLLGGQIRGSAAIGADGTLYVGNAFSGGLYALRADGTPKWNASIGGVNSTPTVGNDGTIYVGGGSKLYAVDASGTVKWSYATGANLSYIQPKLAYGVVYFGSTDGKVYAIR